MAESKAAAFMAAIYSL